MENEDVTMRRILTGARNLLSDPENWVQGPLAVDGRGVSVLPESETACAWCSLGAVDREYFRMFPNSERQLNSMGLQQDDYLQIAVRCELEEAVFWHTKGECRAVPRFNDRSETEHSEVLAVFDKAIAKLDKIVEANRKGNK